MAIAAGRSCRPAAERPRRAGLSVFGFSGTNAHLIVEEPPLADHETRARPADVLTLSARDDAPSLAGAGRPSASRTTWSVPVELSDAAWTTQVGRSRLPHRLAVAAVGSGRRDEVRAWLAGEEAPGVAYRETSGAPQVAFVFTGQGAQHPGMGWPSTSTSPCSEPRWRSALATCAPS